MAKQGYVNVRVDEHVKEEAETILSQLGINMSTAIDLFLTQLILKKGLPFSVVLPTIPYEQAKAELNSLGTTQINSIDQQWFEEIIALYQKRVIPLDVAFYLIAKKNEEV